MPTVTLYPSADAYVDQHNPDSNYGSATSIWVRTRATGWNLRGFLKFDLSSLPANARILSARLRLYAAAAYNPLSPDTDIECRAVADDTWTEAGITWNNQPAFGDVLRVNPMATGWREWHVEAFVKSEFEGGDTLVSFCLKCVTEDFDGTLRQTYFYSKEWDGYDPELVIEYFVPPPYYYATNDYNGAYTDWERYGFTPYLDMQDQPSNYVRYVGVGTDKYIGIFDFQDSEAEEQAETIGTVTLEVHGYRTSDPDLGPPSVYAYIWDGSVWQLKAVPLPSSWGWVSVAITDIIDTWAKVDGARVYFLYAGTTAAMSAYIDAARLKVTLPAIVVKKPIMDGFVYVE